MEFRVSQLCMFNRRKHSHLLRRKNWGGGGVIIENALFINSYSNNLAGIHLSDVPQGNLMSGQQNKWSLSLVSEGRFDGAFLFCCNFPALSIFFSTDVMKSSK